MLVHAYFLGIRHSLGATSPVLWVLAAAAVILPFLVAYYTGAFYTQAASYVEFPQVDFANQFAVVVRGTRGAASPVDWTAVFSTNATLNDALVASSDSVELRVPTFKVWQEDVARDGRNDYMDLELDMPLRDDERVHALDMLLLFQYSLSDKYPATLNVLGRLSVPPSPFSLAEAQVNGSLSLVQQPAAQLPLSVAKYNALVAYQPLALLASSSASGLAEAVIAAQSAQDMYAVIETAEQQHVHPLVTRHPRARGAPLRLTARVSYSPARVWYTPSTPEVLKFAWVQYVSIGLAVWWCSRQVLAAAVRLGVVRTRVHVDRWMAPAPAGHVRRAEGSGSGNSGVVGVTFKPACF